MGVGLDGCGEGERERSMDVTVVRRYIYTTEKQINLLVNDELDAGEAGEDAGSGRAEGRKNGRSWKTKSQDLESHTTTSR